MSVTFDRDLAALLRDSPGRVSSIWCLAAFGDTAPESFREAFEGGPWPTELAWAADLFAEDREEPLEDWEAWELFLEGCSDRRLLGFVILAECPVFTATCASSVSYSWGHYRLNGIYAETIETGLKAAVDWFRENYLAALRAFDGAKA
jgi:hypothetical protein